MLIHGSKERARPTDLMQRNDSWALIVGDGWLLCPTVNTVAEFDGDPYANKIPPWVKAHATGTTSPRVSRTSQVSNTERQYGIICNPLTNCVLFRLARFVSDADDCVR